jgi:hypothetical protein
MTVGAAFQLLSEEAGAWLELLVSEFMTMLSDFSDWLFGHIHRPVLI